jgi:DNA-binding NarL/FixJ family response regulator
MASPILRDTIKKLKDRRTLLQRQVKGPLAELAQIEEDLRALGATSSSTRRAPRAPRAVKAPRTASAPRAASAPRPPRGAQQGAILRAIRNGATTPEEIAGKTDIADATVRRAVTTYLDKSRLLTRGPNGLTLTKAGREKLAELEAE